MQNPSEADAAKQSAAEQRTEDFLQWKKEFFRARPPPPPIGQLRRRQVGPKGGTPVREALKRAREIVAREGAQPPPLPVTGGSSRPADPPTKQEAWVQLMAGEQGRRNPFVDLSIRSDSRRTVIMANLHASTVEEELRAFADQFGRVVGVRIVRETCTGKSRRYAFVEFGLPAEAHKAAQFTRKKRLRGHAIIIDLERGRTDPAFLPKRLASAREISDPTPAKAPDVVQPAPTAGDDAGDAEDDLLASILGGL